MTQRRERIPLIALMLMGGILAACTRCAEVAAAEPDPLCQEYSAYVEQAKAEGQKRLVTGEAIGPVTGEIWLHPKRLVMTTVEISEGVACVRHWLQFVEEPDVDVGLAMSLIF